MFAMVPKPSQSRRPGISRQTIKLVANPERCSMSNPKKRRAALRRRLRGEGFPESFINERVGLQKTLDNWASDNAAPQKVLDFLLVDDDHCPTLRQDFSQDELLLELATMVPVAAMERVGQAISTLGYVIAAFGEKAEAAAEESEVSQ